MKNFYYTIIAVFISASILVGCGGSATSSTTIKDKNIESKDIVPKSLPIDKATVPSTNTKNGSDDDIPKSLPIDKTTVPSTNTKNGSNDDIPKSLPIDKSVIPAS